ncbi:MAG: methyl-accepting chemotaxis protein [Myxococcota bacterium]
MFRRISFQTRILSLPALAAVALLAVVVSNLFIGRTGIRALEVLGDQHLPEVRLTALLTPSLSRLHRSFSDAVARSETEEFVASNVLADELQGVLIELEELPQQRAMLESARSQVAEYCKVATSVSSALIQGELGLGEGPSEAEVSGLQRRYRALEVLFDDVQRDAQNDMRRAIEVATGSYTSIISISVVLGVSAVLILLVLAIWIARPLVQSLDLATKHVSEAASFITQISTQTAHNAAQEASEVEATKQTMNALLGAAVEISDGATTLLKEAKLSELANMSASSSIEELDAQATRISDISELIRTIADKSDMLALNAALEGSKAGEAGKGFVLVGAEMRRLSESVAQAVQQIKDLADGVLSSSKSAVTATERGRTLSSQTTETAERITKITQRQRVSTESVSTRMTAISTYAHDAETAAMRAKATAEELEITAASLIAILRGSAENGHRGPTA